MRIISLVPSITELLYKLGLNDEVIALTKFCVHPKEWHNKKTRIGGTKNIHIEKIKSLKPNLIIANKEENVKEQVEELAEVLNVLLTDVNNYTEALEMITTVGKLVKKAEKAKEVTTQIESSFKNLQNKQSIHTALYFIWKDPWMTVGGDTFISSMMQKAGFKNIFDTQKRYPVVMPKELQNLHPQYVLLSSEPYPFKKKHMAELQNIFTQSKILLVDGEMFSWYGSRMVDAAAYFKSLK